MTSRRVACLVALALLVGAAWQGWRTPRVAPASAITKGNEAPPASRAIAPARRASVVAVVRAVEPLSPTAPLATLSQDDSALLAEQVALQQRLADTGLQLAPEQWAAFAAVSLHHQAIRHAYEATIATAAAAGERRVRMEIPAYPSAGDALRALLFADLREKLGAGVADEIALRGAAALEGHFGGFGVSVQTLEFVREPGGTEADYYVTRTVNYWNAATAQANSTDRLTTRREVHFPGLEDPSGHSWGPLLSVVASPAAKAGS